MTALKAVLSIPVIVIGFVLFVVWLAFYKIPRNILCEFSDYK